MRDVLIIAALASLGCSSTPDHPVKTKTSSSFEWRNGLTHLQISELRQEGAFVVGRAVEFVDQEQWRLEEESTLEFQGVVWEELRSEEIASESTGQVRTLESGLKEQEVWWRFAFGGRDVTGTATTGDDGAWRVDLSFLRDEIYEDIDLYGTGLFVAGPPTSSGGAEALELPTIQQQCQLEVDLLAVLEEQ